jgi:transcriptional regulator with XRE-family HTH domain
MIGKKLKDLIKERNIKQINLAQHVGISPSRLSNYLSDKREPDLEILAAMALYLSVDLNYFAEVKFDPATVAYASQLENSDDSKAEEESKYESNIPGAICVPYLSINAKKRASRVRAAPLWEALLEDIENPQETVVLFEVTTGVGDDHFSQGDYIVAKKFDKNIGNGSMVFETGRNGKIYHYVKDKEAQFLLADNTNEIIHVANKDLSGFYTIIWVIKKP